LKNEKMVEKKSLYIRGPFLLTKFFLVLMMMLWLGMNLLTLEDIFHDTDSRSNLFKEWEDDINQLRSDFGLKIFVGQFCEIKHISQKIHRNKLKFYREIQDIWNYIW